MITRARGTRDILDLTLFHFILKQIRTHLLLYQFHEIETPIIEPLELFVRSLGEHTDVISKEMFLIERHVQANESSERLCLRPEATASVIRAFIENGIQQTPWKVFLCGPMFRHERPQKGRYRQFYQANIEIVDAPNIAHDVQLIIMFDRLFKKQFQFDTYALLINFLGCGEDRANFEQKLEAFLDGLPADVLCDQCHKRRQKNILRIFDCKNEQCQKMYQQAPKTIDCLCVECADEWQRLQHELHIMSVSYVVKSTLVRGLDYYEKTVFEFVSEQLGAQSTFCGGGRYHKLATQFGAKNDVPSIGAAIGIDRLAMILEGKQLPLPQAPSLALIMPMTKQLQPLGLLIADTLRSAGLCTDVLLDNPSLKSMMRAANKLGARWALVVGEEEQQARTVTVKNMQTGSQETIAQIDLVAYLRG